MRATNPSNMGKLSPCGSQQAMRHNAPSRMEEASYTILAIYFHFGISHRHLADSPDAGIINFHSRQEFRHSCRIYLSLG